VASAPPNGDGFFLHGCSKAGFVVRGASPVNFVGHEELGETRAFNEAERPDVRLQSWSNSFDREYAGI